MFYDKNKALDWVNQKSFPIVFKLRGGAGSANVTLVKNKSSAIKLINQAFGKGFSQFNKFTYLKDRFVKWRTGKDSLIGVCKALVRLVKTTDYAKLKGREKGYAYFQEFIPNNLFDIRIIVVGNRAFAIKRMVRKMILEHLVVEVLYERKFDINCVRIAFNINKILKSQSIAFDFVFDKNSNPLIVEISYGFSKKVYDACTGYWDSKLKWHKEKINPQGWMIQHILDDVEN